MKALRLYQFCTVKSVTKRSLAYTTREKAWLSNIYANSLKLPSGYEKNELLAMLSSIKPDTINLQQTKCLVNFIAQSALRKHNHEKTVEAFNNVISQSYDKLFIDSIKSYSDFETGMQLLTCLSNLQIYDSSVYQAVLKVASDNLNSIIKDAKTHFLPDLVWSFVKIEQHGQHSQLFELFLKTALNASNEFSVSKKLALLWLVSSFDYNYLTTDDCFKKLVESVSSLSYQNFSFNGKNCNYILQAFISLYPETLSDVTSYRYIYPKNSSTEATNEFEMFRRLANISIAFQLKNNRSDSLDYSPSYVTEDGHQFLIQHKAAFYNASSTEKKFCHLLQNALNTINVKQNINYCFFELDFLVNDELPVELDGAAHFVYKVARKAPYWSVYRSTEKLVKTKVKADYCRRLGLQELVSLDWDFFFGPKALNYDGKIDLIRESIKPK